MMRTLALLLAFGLISLTPVSAAATDSSDDTCLLTDGALNYAFCVLHETVTDVEEALCGSDGCARAG